jgi:hypothetical protein
VVESGAVTPVDGDMDRVPYRVYVVVDGEDRLSCGSSRMGLDKRETIRSYWGVGPSQIVEAKAQPEKSVELVE